MWGQMKLAQRLPSSHRHQRPRGGHPSERPSARSLPQGLTSKVPQAFCFLLGFPLLEGGVARQRQSCRQVVCGQGGPRAHLCVLAHLALPGLRYRATTPHFLPLSSRGQEVQGEGAQGEKGAHSGACSLCPLHLAVPMRAGP